MRATTCRRWVAVTGVGALTLGLAAMPAAAFETKPGGVDLGGDGAQEADFRATVVKPLSSGTEALSQLTSSDNLDVVARRAGMKPQRLASLLKDEAAIVSSSGFVALVDDWSPEDQVEALAAAPAADVPGNPQEGSKPGAAHTVFLDFDGHTIADTAWNFDFEVGDIEVAPYGVDDDFKRAVWETVVQDYAPFDVNVTTADPGRDALVKTSADDNEYGSHVVIVPDDSVFPAQLQGTGGWALLGGFGSDYLSPAMVFAGNIGDNPYYVGSAASHEAGHNLGLDHHGIEGDDTAYYYGEVPASPEALWGPIMGAPYTVPMSQWSDGGYANAKNPGQDDIDTMLSGDAAQQFPLLFDQEGNRWTEGACFVGDDPSTPQPGDEFYEPNEGGTCDPLGDPLEVEWQYTDRTGPTSDEHGDSAGEASTLDNSGTDFVAQGNIGTADDADVFAVVTSGGPVSAAVAPAGAHSNVDLKLTLRDADGNVVAENEPQTTVDPAGYPANPTAEGADAAVEEELDAGTYYLAVTATGEGNPADNTPSNGSGYTSYGSLGYYELAGSAEPFEAAPVVISSPEDGAEVERSNLEVAGTAEPEAEIELTIGDETVGTATADAEGSWSTALESDLPYGESTITAQQTVGAIEVPETAEVTVTVPLSAPEIVQPEEGDTANTAMPTFGGTGVAGATVTATIVCGDDSRTFDAAVDDDGNWSFQPEEGLPNGDCTIEAVQEINGVTSAAAGPVSFSIQADGGEDGGEGGTEDGDEEGDEDGGDLPDTGSASLLGLAAGIVLMALGSLLYARTRRETV